MSDVDYSEQAAFSTVGLLDMVLVAVVVFTLLGVTGEFMLILEGEEILLELVLPGIVIGLLVRTMCRRALHLGGWPIGIGMLARR